MWDQRYQTSEYVYGTAPNDFLRENFQHLPMGKVLSLAEGEGRNAVFLAKQGYEVTAVDSSMVGLEKTQKLAEHNKVKIDIVHADLTEFEIKPHSWQGIISIFCPMLPNPRKVLHQNVMTGLSRNGVYLLEAYRPEQINLGTGGGDDPAIMQTADTLQSELQGLNFKHLEEVNRDVLEGTFHNGAACVVQVIAVKNQ